jgi:membrane-bound lytic murein transglycosylase D
MSVPPSYSTQANAPVATGHYTATQSASLWRVIASGFTLNHNLNNPQVKAYVSYYKNHPQMVAAITARAQPYLYHIVQQVKARKLPMELALLPFIESGFRPRIHSYAGAVGIWQLIPATADRFGTTDSWWYSGSQDVQESTRAALNYLIYLNGYFNGNWQLAIAAYNSGEGTVKRAMRYNTQHGMPADFWTLNLPNQTRDYVPKLLALSEVIAHPGRYGLSLTYIPSRAVTLAVALPHQMGLDTVARFAGISHNMLKALNPGFKRIVTPPKGDYMLMLPASQVLTFEKNLSAHPDLKNTKWNRYIVKRHDTLARVAHVTGNTLSRLQFLNNLKGNRIRVGQSLIYRIAYRTYTIKRGDTLSGIAAQYNLDLHALMGRNHLNRHSVLSIGQVLKIS